MRSSYVRNLSLNVLLPALFVTIFSGCIPRKAPDDSSTKDLVFDQNANNIALLFGASNGLAGVDTDLRELKALLENPQYRFGFKVVVVREATAEQMVSVTRQYAAALGNNGTLMWYWSGHGAEGSGCMYTNSGCTSFAPVAQALRQARATPIKRFFFFADSCFSGQLVAGNSAILSGGSGSSLRGASATPAYSLSDAVVKTYTDRAADDINGILQDAQSQGRASNGTGLFDQALTMSAARADETSADLGAGEGGAFTYSLRRVLTRLATQPNATIRDLVSMTTSTTSSEFGHTPSYRTIPGEMVLNDRLFGGDMATSQGGSGQGGQGGNPPPSQGAVPNALFAKMGPLQANGSSYLYVSAPAAATARVGLCRGNLQQCKATPTASVQFAPVNSSVPGVALFRSTTPVTWVNGETMVLFGQNQQGQTSLGFALQTRMK